MRSSACLITALPLQTHAQLVDFAPLVILDNFRFLYRAGEQPDFFQEAGMA